jgi:nitrite reductase/ring-hydroxylating ferredoxin subunit
MTVETTLTRLCSLDDVAEGAAFQVALDGRRPIAVFRIDEGVFALDDTCSHGNAFLSEGDIEDCQVYCPFHSGAFDIRTGAATVAPCVKPVKSYPVVVRDGAVFVDLER